MSALVVKVDLTNTEQFKGLVSVISEIMVDKDVTFAKGKRLAYSNKIQKIVNNDEGDVVNE